MLNKIPKWTLVAGLLVTAFSLRIVHLLGTDIAGDEPFSIFIAQFNVPWIISYLSTGNNPPLFEILLHYYMVVFGDSEFALRLFPTIFSSLTVIPLFLIGDRFFSRRTALLATLLFILSIQHIRFAHEIRVYSLFALTTGCTLLTFLSVSGSKKINIWMGLTLCNTILLYSHFTSFYLLVVEVFCSFLIFTSDERKKLFLSLSISGMLFSPYVLIFLERFGNVTTNGTWVAKPGLGEIYGSINLMLNQRLTTVFIVTSALIGSVLNRNRKHTMSAIRNHNVGLTVMCWFAIPYMAMFMVSILKIPMFTDRYLLYTSIPLFLTTAWLIDKIWNGTNAGKWSIIGTLIALFGSIVTTDLNPSNNREIKATVVAIKNWNDDSTKVFISPSMFRLAVTFHYDKELFRQVSTSYAGDDPLRKLDSLLNARDIFPIDLLEQSNLKGCNRVIYLDADSKFVLPDNSNLETLESNFVMKNKEHFHQIFDVYLFERN